MYEAINKKEGIRLVIEEDENVGFYLFVYPLNSNKNIADYHCDTMEQVYIKAERAYKVKQDEFVKK